MNPQKQVRQFILINSEYFLMNANIIRRQKGVLRMYRAKSM